MKLHEGKKAIWGTSGKFLSNLEQDRGGAKDVLRLARGKRLPPQETASFTVVIDQAHFRNRKGTTALRSSDVRSRHDDQRGARILKQVGY